MTQSRLPGRRRRVSRANLMTVTGPGGPGTGIMMSPAEGVARRGRRTGPGPGDRDMPGPVPTS